MGWFAAPFLSSIVADYILSKNSKIKFLTTHSNEISGAVLGSQFFIFCFPMIAMTFLEFYVYNDIFPYDLIPSSYDVLGNIWLITLLPGAVSGIIGSVFAQKKLFRIFKLEL